MQPANNNMPKRISCTLRDFTGSDSFNEYLYQSPESLITYLLLADPTFQTLKPKVTEFADQSTSFESHSFLLSTKQNVHHPSSNHSPS